MLKGLLIGLVALVLAVVVIGFILPDEAHVERAVTIHAPACTIYAQMDDFRRFNLWSPWAEIDPDGTTYTFSGPDRGVGAKMEWSSEDKNVGSGSQEITAVEPYEEVRTSLDFGDQGKADAVFLLDDEAGDGVRVTWAFDTSFEGRFLGRFFGLFMDSWVGADFEDGLGNLKTLTEGLPQEPWCDLEIDILDVPEKVIVSTRGRSGHTPEEIGSALGQAYGAISAFLGTHGLQAAGQPLAISESFDDDGYRFEAGIPVAQDPRIDTGEGDAVGVRTVPATRAVRLVHVGPYRQLTESYNALTAFLAARGLEANGPSWEEYISDPGEIPEEELVTHIYMPIEG